MVTSSFPSRQRGPCRASERGSFLGGAFWPQQSELGWKEQKNKVRPFCAQIHAVFVPVARLHSPSLIKREHSGDDTQVIPRCILNVLGKAMAPHSSTLAMDGGAWKAAVHGVAEGWTRLSDFTFTFHFHTLGKDMATHSSVLAWIVAAQLSSSGDFHPECHLRYRMGK